MATLDDLPDEILLLICEALSASGGVRPLLLVSKRLYKVALPVFTRHVTLKDAVRAQRHFCSTFVLCDNLARLVESVCADVEWAYEYEDKPSALADEKKENIDDEAVIDRLVARVCDIFHDDEDERKKWQRGIEVQDTKYMLPLALAHLPNISELQMGHSYETGFWDNLDALVTQMRGDSRLSADKKPVQKVERVFIDSTIDKYPVTPLPLAMVAKWPAIRSITIGAAGNEDGDEVESAFTDLEPKSRSLERVELCPRSKLLDGNLHGLLRASKGLREFKYHIGHSWAWIDFHTPELQKSLDQHQGTLERLSLWYDLMELDVESDSVVRPMNFSAYTHLADLSIDTVFLFDTNSDGKNAQPRLTELLPASLVRLHVVQVGIESAKEVAAGLTAVLKHSRNFPDLEVLEVSCTSDDLRRHGTRAIVADTGLRDLAPLAKEMGIKFRLIKCDEDSETGMTFFNVDLLDPENDVKPKSRD